MFDRKNYVYIMIISEKDEEEHTEAHLLFKNYNLLPMIYNLSLIIYRLLLIFSIENVQIIAGILDLFISLKILEHFLKFDFLKNSLTHQEACSFNKMQYLWTSRYESFFAYSFISEYLKLQRVSKINVFKCTMSRRNNFVFRHNEPQK
jgi:hypothetical protein